MPAPLYRQIAEELRAQIESGELVPGSQLPTELDLRQRYDASRNTIRDALKWLTARGLIEGRAGQGTFVMKANDPVVTLLSGPYEIPGRDIRGADAGELMVAMSEPRVEVRAAGEVAAMLGLPVGAEVVSRQEIRFIDGMVWTLRTSFYPRELVERGAERLLGIRVIEEGVLRYLEDALGLRQVGYQDRIRVGPPDKEEAELFKLPDDGRVSVITVLRTSYAADRSAFQVTITAYPGDRNELLVNSGDLPPPNFPEADE